MKYCARPYEYLYLADDTGDIYLCPWMYRVNRESSIGNLLKDDIETCYNSDFANELRNSIEDQSFRYCRNDACPRIQNNSFEEITIEEYGNRKQERYYPIQINLAYDFVCNQSCETCRQSIYIPPKDYEEKMEIIQQRIKPYLDTATVITTSGNGELFVQKHTIDLLSNLRPKNPSIEILLETNGVYFDDAHWERISHLGKFNLKVVVTSNSFNEFTYKYISRGGNYQKMMHNLGFMSELRNNNFIKELSHSFVIQDRNFREIPEFIRKSFQDYSFDTVVLKPVYKWSSIDDETFWFKDVLNPLHPYHSEYLEIMKDPILKDSRVFNFAGDMLHEARTYLSAILTIRYIFPYDLVKKNSKVVIYGAGQVGREFVRQLKLNCYCNVVFWVDRSFKNERVSSPDCLLNMPQDDYDYIVLATTSGLYAEEMKCNLIDMKISEERIVSCIHEDGEKTK